MGEIYKKWIPVENIDNEMWAEAIHDDYEGLRILLKGNTPTSAVLNIRFPQYFAYRNTDESYRLKLWQEGVFDDIKWSLFTTKESRFIDWVFEQSQEIYSKSDMSHYLIKTGADVIEVVTNQTLPVVNWLRPNSSLPSEEILNVKKGKRGTYYDK